MKQKSKRLATIETTEYKYVLYIYIYIISISKIYSHNCDCADTFPIVFINNYYDYCIASNFMNSLD